MVEIPLESDTEKGPSSLENEVKPEKLYFGYPKEKLTILVVFAVVHFLASTIYSLQGPFYPQEAEKKGASATEYGLVLGVFQLTMFIMSPICGVILGRVSPRLVYSCGITTTAVATVLFGFLEYVNGHYSFLLLSLLLRILQAVGEAAFITASLTIVQIQFPESVATISAALESFWGFGTIVGLSLGGALYELGGFILPFLCMGSCLLFMSSLTYCILPDVTCPVTKPEEKTSIKSIMRIPDVMLGFATIIVAASSVGFLISTLEPHLRESFGLTPGMTGMVFMIDGVMYAAAAPLWGKLCDITNQPKVVSILGAALVFTGFLFIGPAPFIPLKTVLGLTCVGLAIHGLGVPALYISGFIQTLKGSVSNGLPENVSTSGLVSGLFISSMTLGMFLGSALGGILLDYFGFKYASIFVLVTQVLIGWATAISFCVKFKVKSKGDLESASLLQNDTSFIEDDVNNLKTKDPQDEFNKQRKNPFPSSADYGAI